MFFYRVYGLNIHSHLELPELTPHKGTPDVSINFGKVKFSEDKSFTSGTKYRIRPGKIHLSWSEVGSFRLINSKITIEPSDDVDDNILREVLLGPVFAVLLYQRGNLVLHASAVNVEGSAIAFLGYAGYGKSTLSLKMYEKGHSLITDDILRVILDDNHLPVVYPSFPMIKLESDVLSGNRENLKIMKKDSHLDKKYYFLPKNFSTAPIPLKTAYVLKRSDKVGIEELDLQNALRELLPHSYCLKLFQDEEKFLNLVQCANLIEKIPVKVLNTGKSLEDLSEVIDIIEKDIS